MGSVKLVSMPVDAVKKNDCGKKSDSSDLWMCFVSYSLVLSC